MMAVPVATWVEALEEAAVEVAELALGFDRSAAVVSQGTTPKDVAGAYLPLFGGSGESLYVGWLGTLESRRALARGLLTMTPDEELSDADVNDAIGEVVNILAGGIKRRMVRIVSPLNLGLPIFTEAPLKSPHSTTTFRILRCGDVDSHLVLLHAAERLSHGS